LGTDIPLKRVADILRSLGFVIKKISAGALVVAAPSFRNDIKREIDVIEEISRIYGYDNIPSTVPALIDQPVRIDRDMAVKNRIRSCLAALGMNEIITYSLISRRAAASSGMQGGGLAEVQNPLTTEQEIMRPSLIPGMLQVFMWNINRKNRDLRLFELGNIYGIRPDGQYSEKTCLSIGIAGSLFAGWAGGDRAADFFELKGIVETLLSETGLNAVSFRGAHNGSFASTECAEILSGEKILGIMGRIGSRVAGNFDIKENVYILEMDAEALFEKASLEKRFFELPRYPSVYRDISIVVSKDAPNAELVLLMKRSAGAVLKDAILIDRYEGRQVPDGKLSLTYRLEYRSLSKTLEEKEVLEVHSRVLQELEDKFGAKLR
jgi:phenylalanyl-tRNA synthetase beta chain